MSLGSSSAPLTSRPSRSLTAFTYSARFRRCEATRPGLGDAPAARSSARSIDAMKPSSVAMSGRGEPSGGIVLPRSLRATFSRIAAWRPTSATSMFVRMRLPLFTRSLWQPTQYLSSSAREGAAVAAAGVPAVACGPAAYVVVNGRCPAPTDTMATRPSAIRNLDMRSLGLELLHDGRHHSTIGQRGIIGAVEPGETIIPAGFCLVFVAIEPE